MPTVPLHSPAPQQWRGGIFRALGGATAAAGAYALLTGAAAVVRGACAAVTTALGLHELADPSLDISCRTGSAALSSAAETQAAAGGLGGPGKPLDEWCEELCGREELLERDKFAAVMLRSLSADCELPGGASIGAYGAASQEPGSGDACPGRLPAAMAPPRRAGSNACTGASSMSVSLCCRGFCVST